MATGLSSITGLLSLIGSLQLACAASGLSYNGLAQTPQMGWVSPKALIPTLRLPKSRSAAFQVMHACASQTVVLWKTLSNQVLYHVGYLQCLRP